MEATIDQKPWLILTEEEGDVDMFVINGTNAFDAKEKFKQGYPDAVKGAIHIYPYSGNEEYDLDSENQYSRHLLNCIRCMQSELAGSMGLPSDTPWRDMIAAINARQTT